MTSRFVEIPAGVARLEGDLCAPAAARGVILFAHGTGSSRFSPRNQRIARTLQEAGFGTLLFDLLCAAEEQVDQATAHLRFDIDLLAGRLVAATDWLLDLSGLRALPVGYFGASTGGAAALVAAAERPRVARAVVSRGGRPDLAGHALPRVLAPTLLIVGELDHPVLELNRAALVQLRCPADLAVVPGATHLFPEPGALDEVARLATNWFLHHLGGAG